MTRLVFVIRAPGMLPLKRSGRDLAIDEARQLIELGVPGVQVEARHAHCWDDFKIPAKVIWKENEWQTD